MIPAVLFSSDVLVSGGDSRARPRSMQCRKLRTSVQAFLRLLPEFVRAAHASSIPVTRRTTSTRTIRAILFFVLMVVSLGQSFAQPARPPGQNKSRGNAAAQRPAASPSGSPSEKKPADAFGGSSKDQPKGPTEITASQEAQFDMGSRTGVFLGNVKVVDPQFTMTADKLTVHLNKQEEGGGLDRAEADGNVYIVHLNPQKPPEGGAPAGQPASQTGQQSAAQTAQASIRSTGKSEHAYYQAKDGSVTLVGWPQVTQGVNTHIAMDPSVKMILFRDGRMKTYGSTRTVIQDRTEPSKPQANAAQ
jgi:LptA/(LptD N-terminal domain) LPS transport protein